MEQTQHETKGPADPDRPRELVRPHRGRMLAGVAQGLADRFEIPVLLVRAIFVILALGGGGGILLYFTGWFLIPSESESTSPAERFFAGFKSAH